MNTFLIILFTLIIIASLITNWYITNLTKITNALIRVNEAEEKINEELNNRYELIKGIKTIVKRNTKMELNLFKDLETVKETNISNYDYEKFITQAIDTLEKIKNDYPKLDEKKEFKTTMTKLDESTTRLTALKNFYNTHNQILNNNIKKFPTKIICKIKKIKIRPYYDTKELFNENDDCIKI